VESMEGMDRIPGSSVTMLLHWRNGSTGGARAAARTGRRAGDALRSERRRRVLNVATALIALIVCAPLMLLIAVLVRLTSPGPVFYSQWRVGALQASRNGNGREAYRRFRLYKFRTMYDGADRQGQVWAAPDDPRVTPLGRFLRLYRLDELPQLVNVLMGDMNIVGPRPEQPRIFMDLREKVQHYPNRQRVLPGITGLAQINQHYDRCLEDVRKKVDYDLQYIDRRSAMEDLRIMAATVPVVLFKKGAW
jgi:lipopolysaccharide/colanic/teichoic acid biosynthesis glycosyltransferase